MNNRLLAKTFAQIDVDALEMGDNYYEIVENLLLSAGFKTDIEKIGNDMDHNALSKFAIKAYEKMIEEKDASLGKIVEYYIDPDEIVLDGLINNAAYDIKIIDRLITVGNFAQENNLGNIKIISAGLNHLKEVSRIGISTGKALGNCYFKFLNPDLFGPISNDFNTVGYAEKTKNYDYIFRKSFNCLELDKKHSFACMVKGNGSTATAKVYSCFDSSENICDHNYSFSLLGIIEVNPKEIEPAAKKIADIMNTEAPRLKEISHKEFLKKYNEKLNEFLCIIEDNIPFKKTTVITHDEECGDIEETRIEFVTSFGSVVGQTCRPCWLFLVNNNEKKYIYSLNEIRSMLSDQFGLIV